MEEQILTEVNLSRVKPTSIIKGAMRVDQQSVIIVVPDTNLKIWDEIYDTGFLLTNCQAIVSPIGKLTFARKRYNSKIHQLDLKKNMLKREGPGRKLRIIANIPRPNKATKAKLGSRPDKRYYFYDASVLSKGLGKSFDRINHKMLNGMFFDQLAVIYKRIKNVLPLAQVEIMFIIKNEEGKLFELMKNFPIHVKDKDLAAKVSFDNYMLFSNAQRIMMPIAYKQKGVSKFHRGNIKKVSKYFEVKKDAKEIEKESAVEATGDSTLPADSFVSKLVNNLRTTNLRTNVSSDGNVNIGLDRNEITKLLKKHKINDPDIAINVKAAVDAYVNEKGEKLTTDEAENIVLKSINYTIHGSDDVSEEYIAKPQLLFNKLKETKTYRVPLEFPNIDYVIDPKSVVDIDYTTGQHRQKFEFEEVIHENVRKLLKSIEDVKEHPIKVKKVKWNVEDDTQDRFILYTVTLQNISGENKEPYDVQLKVPSPVNDKYFKLHGSSYIIASQQFMKPVTKTDKNDVRILSNYAIIKIGIKNLKFNPSDIDEIIDKYIKVRYPNLIIEHTKNSVTFKDKSTIFFSGDTVHINGDKSISVNSDTGKLVDENEEELRIGKNEYLYEVLLKQINTMNPEDKLYRTKKSVPYTFIYLSGFTIPLIMYMWAQKGLLTTLNDFGIDYQMSNTDQLDSGYFFVPTGDKFLAITPKSTKEKLIVNGLIVSKVKKPIDDLDNPELIEEHISNVYGSGAVYAIHNMTENMIDPVTKELLEFENLPTKLPNLISQHCVPILMNQKADSLADLKIYRSRMSEMVLQSMYKQIKQAHNDYKNKVNFGDPKAKFWLDTDYIIKDMITDAGVLQHTEPVTPVDEIMLASRVIKSGKGGVQNKQMFKAEQRNIHTSQYGIISANSTPEGSNVGIINKHTLTPAIVNKYGSYGAKDISGLSGWNCLAIEEALIPFQNEMDSDRLVMAATHQGQVTPISGSEAPLVGTGAEFIVPQLTSPRFAHKAKEDGIVKEIEPGKFITVRYKSGKIETFDISPRLSRTKMGGYIALEMNTLDKGKRFKKNELVGFTKNFTKDSRYASGKNVFVAVLNPMGYGHEDAYVISEKFSQDASRDMVKEVAAIIPTDAKLLNMTKKIGTKVEKDDVLLEFVYQDNLDSYLELNDLVDEEDKEILSIFGAGDNSIKLLAPEGEIIDIKVFINNRNSIDPQIVKFHKSLVTDTKKTIGKLGKTASDKMKAVDNIDVNFFKTSGHKYKQNEFQGARVVYYIKQKKPLIGGDKIANRYGAKGVIGKVFKDNPKGELTESIDVFISPVGIFSRKNIAMVKELYLGKIMYYLNKKCQEWATNSKVKTDKIIKTVVDTYNILGIKDVHESVTKQLKGMTEAKIRRQIKSGDLKFYFLIKPFETIKFENLKTAAEHLDIQLDEKVYIPELDTWTEHPVPVGVAYFNALEQFSEIYSNIRGTGMYQGLTRQPSRGKSKQGGQSIGGLDMNALLTYDVPSVMNELFTLRSDDHRSKRMVNSNIITDGHSEIPKSSGKGGTSQLLDVYITGMGLEII